MKRYLLNPIASVLILCGLATALRADVITSYLTAEGDWGIPDNWSNPAIWSSAPFYPNNGKGGNTYNAVVVERPRGGVILTENIALNSLEMDGATLFLNGFRLRTDSCFMSAAIHGPGTITANSHLNIGDVDGNGIYLYYGASLVNSGSGIIQPGSGIFLDGLLENRGELQMRDGGIVCYGDGDPSGTIDNSGLIDFSNALLNGDPGRPGNFLIQNSGVMRATQGNARFCGCAIYNGKKGILEVRNSIPGETAHWILSQNSVFVNDGGTIHLIGGKFATDWDFVFASGEIVLEDDGTFGLYTPPHGGILDIPAKGALRGHGWIPNHVSSKGLISCGPIGRLAMNSLTLNASSIVEIHLGRLATDNDAYLQIAWWGASLGGKLELRLAEGFAETLKATDELVILTALSDISGSFANARPGERVGVAGGRGSFRIVYDNENWPKRVVLTDFRPSGR
jgi:hypothetical protein